MTLQLNQLLCVVLMAGVASATITVHSPCTESVADVCTVEQVRIDPCTSLKACSLKRGTPASISFDFTPKFSASKLKAGLFWASDTDVAFPDLYEADACQYTACPTSAGTQQQFNYSLNYKKILPSGLFLFKWKIWNEEDPSQICCFLTQLRLKKYR